MTDEQQKVVAEWNQWSVYVLKELERLNACYKDLDDKIDAINSKLDDKIVIVREKLTGLQIKVAGIAAAVSIITTLLFLLLKK